MRLAQIKKAPKQMRFTLQAKRFSSCHFFGLSVSALAIGCIAAWLPLPARADSFGFAPSTYPSPLIYGEGVYFAPQALKLYSKPDFTAKVVASYSWSVDNAKTMVRRPEGSPVLARNVFLAFYPSLRLALLPVVSENGQGWAEVAYQQGKPEATAWVPLRSTLEKDAKQSSSLAYEASYAGVFQPWLQFMRLNAKANGITWLQGVSPYSKSMRTAPEDKAKLVQVQMPRQPRILHAKGNWLLMEVTDLGREHPIGWVRWRDDKGQLLAFPNFASQQQGYSPQAN
jgi:hypothetical protein